jgi:hypothetical protein
MRRRRGGEEEGAKGAEEVKREEKRRRRRREGGERREGRKRRKKDTARVSIRIHVYMVGSCATTHTRTHETAHQHTASAHRFSSRDITPR